MPMGIPQWARGFGIGRGVQAQPCHSLAVCDLEQSARFIPSKMDTITAPALWVAVTVPGGGACGSLSADPLAHAHLQPACPHRCRQCASAVVQTAPPLLARPGSPPPASVSELPRWLGGGPQSRWADGAGAGSGGTRFWSCGLPGELPSEKTVTREEAESFAHWSTGAWTKAAQVICHLLMGLINGRRVERGGFLPTASRSIQGLQGDCIFFSAVDAAFHR